MKLKKSKKLEIIQIGRIYAEAKDLDYNGKKVRIRMNENFTKDAAKDNLNKVVELDVNVEFKEAILHPVSKE